MNREDAKRVSDAGTDLCDRLGGECRYGDMYVVQALITSLQAASDELHERAEDAAPPEGVAVVAAAMSPKAPAKRGRPRKDHSVASDAPPVSSGVDGGSSTAQASSADVPRSVADLGNGAATQGGVPVPGAVPAAVAP